MTLGSVLLSPRRARAWPQCPKCPGRSGELQREECTHPPPHGPSRPGFADSGFQKASFPYQMGRQISTPCGCLPSREVT